MYCFSILCLCLKSLAKISARNIPLTRIARPSVPGSPPAVPALPSDSHICSAHVRRNEIYEEY